MTSNDLNQISKLLDERLSVTEKNLRSEISSVEKNLRSEISSVEKNLKSEIKSEIGNSEKRLRTEIDKKGDEVVNVLLNFMQEHVISLFDDTASKSEVDRAERRIDQLADKVGAHNVRLKNIESVPVIAHQRKIKKAK